MTKNTMYRIMEYHVRSQEWICINFCQSNSIPNYMIMELKELRDKNPNVKFKITKTTYEEIEI
jgi:hypothetical protein